MVNNDRIVPIGSIDFLSLIGTILTLEEVDFDLLQASDVEGAFTVATTGTKLAAQPVKSMNFTAESGTVYFVADYGYEGMSISGTAAEPTGEVKADGITLHSATLADGAITIAQITPSAE